LANRVRYENQHPRYAAFIAASPSTAFGHISLKDGKKENARTRSTATVVLLRSAKTAKR